MGCNKSKPDAHQRFEDEDTSQKTSYVVREAGDGADVVGSDGIQRKPSHAEISFKHGADDYSGMRDFSVSSDGGSARATAREASMSGRPSGAGSGGSRPSLVDANDPHNIAARPARRRMSYWPSPPKGRNIYDRYKMGDQLGSGSFAVVRSCTRRSDGKASLSRSWTPRTGPSGTCRTCIVRRKICVCSTTLTS